jgi:transposase-like protein|tara:strand:- start:217 stop:702 length:486 start_codon:yes stop_codon:yes gene_type:complete
MSDELTLVPQVVPQATEDEVSAMIAEEARLAGAVEIHAAAVRLLEAGYTVRETARRLDIRSTTVWRWSREPAVAQAVATGRERRRSALGQRLESAASSALDTLIDVMQDPDVAAKDRVKASEVVLDRCGLVEVAGKSDSTPSIAVDIDFDERLARIVAGGA